MTYTNENGNEKQYQTQVKSSLSTKFGGVLYTNISGYNAESTNIDTIEANIEGTLDIKSQAKQATVNQSFINNYDNEIGEINIVGSVQGENSTIQGISASGEDVKIYYSEEENAKEESNTWKEEATANAKSYKIEKTGALAKTEKIDIKFNLSIPANIQAGEEIVQQTEANYVYNKQKLNTVTKIELEAPTVKISETNGVKTEISAESGRQALQDGDEVYEGQAIRYSVKVTNNTGAALNNFQLTAEHTNAVYYEVTEEEPEYGWTEDYAPKMLFTKQNENATNVTRTQQTIQNGETATFTYQFSPKKKQGIDITGTIKIKADELPEQTQATMTNKIKNAELSIETLNATQEDKQVTEGEDIHYDFSIKNYTDKEQKDIIVTVEPSSSLILSGGDYLPYTQSEEGVNKNYDVISDEDGTPLVQLVNIDNNVGTFKIYSIKPNDTFTFGWICFAAETSDDEIDDDRWGIFSDASVYATAQLNGKTYGSCTAERTIQRLTAKVTAYQDSEIIKSEENKLEDEDEIYAEIPEVGDTVIFKTNIENIDQRLDTEAQVEQQITEYTGKILKSYVQTSKGQQIDAEISGTNVANVTFDLPADDWAQMVTEVEVWENDDEAVNAEEMLESNVEMYWTRDGYLEVSPVTLNLEPVNESGDPEIEEDPADPDETGKIKDSNGQTNQGGNTGAQGNPNNNEAGKYSISGRAWLDSNKNGSRESSEGGISDIEVKLLNDSNGQTVNAVSTAVDGTYVFNNVEPGTYITMFMYNSNKYSVTGYQKDGISDFENSDVIQKTINDMIVAATDNLTIRNSNIINIDAGFVEKENFDLKIDKSITRVAVKNAEGTKITDFNKSKLAKVDIHAKQLANSTVTVEYSFEVTNEGDIAGYATDVIDYMPSDLIFNQDQNPGWYVNEQDKNLHNISLEKEVIEPGETKTLTLVLTKQMTETNTGSSANMAEIGGETNEFSASDIDSTPGNRKEGEDDISTAELLISVKTGLVVYVSIAVIVIALVGVAIIIYQKKKEGEVHENETN